MLISGLKNFSKMFCQIVLTNLNLICHYSMGVLFSKVMSMSSHLVRSKLGLLSNEFFFLVYGTPFLSPILCI